MYAIVEIEGQQFKVEKMQKCLFIIGCREGAVVNFDKVLLVDNNGAVKIGKRLLKEQKFRPKIRPCKR
jgi:large subunit ribosomal protein L21